MYSNPSTPRNPSRYGATPLPSGNNVSIVLPPNQPIYIQLTYQNINPITPIVPITPRNPSKYGSTPLPSGNNVSIISDQPIPSPPSSYKRIGSIPLPTAPSPPSSRIGSIPLPTAPSPPSSRIGSIPLPAAPSPPSSRIGSIPLPTSHQHIGSSHNVECCICQEPNVEPNRLTACKHAICMDCTSMLEKQECPQCKAA